MKLTRQLMGEVFNKTAGHCGYCGIQLNPFERWHTDHIVPVSKGGSDELSNLIPACAHCNLSKNSLSVAEYKRAVKEQAARLIYDIDLTLLPRETRDTILEGLNTVNTLIQEAEILFYFEVKR